MTRQKIEQQPTLKLYYFNIKGKGEAIRLFCAYAGLELEDHRFSSYDEFLALKENGKIAFGQVPMLEVDGKHQLVQTAAILRYLATLTGLYPGKEDPILSAKIDACLDQETDAFTGATVATYTKRFGIELEAEAKAKSYDSINNEILPRHFGNLERLLTSSSTGWLADTKEPSPADVAWYTRLADYTADKQEFSESIRSLEGFPACRAFIEKFRGLKEIQEYYNRKNT